MSEPVAPVKPIEPIERMEETGVYGVLAEFETPEALLAAARAARDAGFSRMDAYTPFPVDGMTDALGKRHTRLQTLVFVCGMTGALVGYGMQYYMAKIDYPINIGGRPLNSWPAFIPVTYELTILFAALGAVIGMLAANKLPMPYHPVFNVPEFSRAHIDRFFLCIQADDPKFELAATKQFAVSLGALSVYEAPI
jgi:hypothetical protein